MKNLAWLALAAAACLAGCVPMPVAPTGLMDVTERPAEKALFAGLRAYEDGQYDPAERLFKQALGAGLASPKDQAEAHKRLAFIDCSTNRLLDCEAEFRAAKKSDPSFALGKSEAGHPVWGPVYRKLQP